MIPFGLATRFGAAGAGGSHPDHICQVPFSIGRSMNAPWFQMYRHRRGRARKVCDREFAVCDAVRSDLLLSEGVRSRLFAHAHHTLRLVRLHAFVANWQIATFSPLGLEVQPNYKTALRCLLVCNIS